MITPIYMPDGSKVYVADNGRDAEGRVKWIIQVRSADGRVLANVNDIRSGVGAYVDPYATLASFASFLGAWVESQDYPSSENRDLFPASLLPWAENNADELWMMTNADEES